MNIERVWNSFPSKIMNNEIALSNAAVKIVSARDKVRSKLDIVVV